MKCLICNQEHDEDYLDFGKITHEKADEFYAEHLAVFVYCNYADKGITFHGDKPTE